jgi:ankyrin repeat protein
VQAGGTRLVHAVRRSDKSTALHYAARARYLDVVKCLVKGDKHNSTFINAVNDKGTTAADLATAYGYMDVVEFLTQAIANGMTP